MLLKIFTESNQSHEALPLASHAAPPSVPK